MDIFKREQAEAVY